MFHWSAARKKERFLSRLPNSETTPFRLCKFFHARHVRELSPIVNRWFCFFIGLHRISLVRAYGDTRRRIFDAFEIAREACFLGEQFCWRAVLRDPVPSPRRAPRPDSPVVCSVFGTVMVIEKKRRWSSSQQPETKSARGAAD